MSIQPASYGALPAAPSKIPADGSTAFGRYAGLVDAISWNRLCAPHARSRLWQHFHHKRWQYAALATDDLFCGIAIVDVGWTNTAFAYAFDRRERREVAGFSRDGLPGLTARLADSPMATNSFRWLSDRIEFISRPDKRQYALRLRCGDFEIDADIDINGVAPFLLAVGPIERGSVHATQKSPGLRLDGEVRTAGKRYNLHGGIASLDYSNGMLARETSWRWASAHSLDVGFNLQAGYFGDHENALWLDGELISLSAASFAFDARNPMAPWRIRTDDGLVELVFQPEGLRREDKNLIVAASRYVQPVGRFNGWVRRSASATPRKIDNLVGVTEDHYSRW